MSEFDGVNRSTPAEIPRLAVGHYSSVGIPAQDRHEAWRQRLWPSVAPLYETRPSEAFEVESRTVQLKGLQVLNTSITGQSYQRSSAMIRSSDPDYLGVLYMAEGNAQGVFGDISANHVPGSLLFGDMAAQSSHRSSASRTASLFVPRQVAMGLGIDPRAAHGRVVCGAPARLLGTHLLQIAEAAPMLAAGCEEQLSRSVLELLAVAANGLGVARPRTAFADPSLILAHAHAEIERKLGSATLTGASLARTLGISRTGLHRLFAQDGGVRGFVRERRLQAALEALQSGDGSESIGAIAERLGFSDGAHLSRLFRARFGLTPTACRHAGAAVSLRI